MTTSRRQPKIWIHSYSADTGLRHTSKVHPKAFISVNARDLQYRSWLQEFLNGNPESPLALYIKCTRHIDLSKPEHRAKALTVLPFVFLHYFRESKGWAVPEPKLPVFNLIAFDWQTTVGSQMVIPLTVQTTRPIDQIELAGRLQEIFESLKGSRPDLLPSKARNDPSCASV